jgi:hypothetical protein
MELKLITTEIKSETSITRDELEFKFFKNMILKDLELAVWRQEAVKVIGELKIYSDYRSDLNSFDYIVAFILGVDTSFLEDSLEEYISSQCTEYFFSIVCKNDTSFRGAEVDKLASNITKYLLKTTTVIKSNPVGGAMNEIRELDRAHFGASNIRSYTNNIMN